jgi:hypothetical protein
MTVYLRPVLVTTEDNMYTKLKYSLAALAFAGLCAPASAMTDAECSAAWIKADVNKDGMLSKQEASHYYGARIFANKTTSDAGIMQADFMADCKGGIYDTKASDPGAPLKGANSFTEAQARGRAEHYGFTAVSAMTKDADGIWRGNATHDGKAGKVAVDFKGNVVAQ